MRCRRVTGLGALALLLACEQGGSRVGDAALRAEDGLSPAAWEAVAGQRVFFAHRSVGNNLLGGIAELQASQPQAPLRVVKGSAPALFAAPVLAHDYVGENGNPDSKAAGFAAALDGGIGGSVDIALFKYCFWDIRRETDEQAVFRVYRETLAGLRRRYPAVTFVHTTVPLTARRTGITTTIRRMLGRADAWDLDNVKRNELNELILREYGGREPVFDIALLESSLPDGRRVTFSHAGRRYAALAPEYSRDGAHLNAAGSRHLGAGLIAALATAARLRGANR